MKRLTMHRYTIQDIMALGPCQPTEDDPDAGYPEDKLQRLFGARQSATLLDICDDERVPVWDRQWVLHRLLPEPLVHEAACRYAEHALERARAAGRDPDHRLREAIKAKRMWLRGEISDDDLDAAESTAWNAAWHATRAAASAAAEAAVWAADRTAAEAAVWDVAQTAERRWQLATLRAMIEAMTL